jgi:hypothetical protein
MKSYTCWDINGFSLVELVDFLRARDDDGLGYEYDGGMFRPDDLSTSLEMAKYDAHIRAYRARAEAMLPVARGYDQEARALSERLRETWCDQNMVKPSRRRACELYVGGRRQKYSSACPIEVDHTSTYQRGGKLLCVVTQPYSISTESLESLAGFCVSKDIAGYFCVEAESYRPGACFALVFVRVGHEHMIPALERAFASRR